VKKMSRFVVFMLMGIACCWGVSAAETVPLAIPTISARINLDGVLDEGFWQDALKLELNYEISPGENTQPPVRTEVFIASTGSDIYIGIMAHDPDPSTIRSHLTDRDTVFDDDWVSISFDTFNDHRRLYTFYCNPYGIQADLIETNAGQNLSWDTIWASTGRITKQGYVVEMSIPFSSLRFQRQKDEQVWGFDILRQYPRNLNHITSFIQRDRNNFCYMCQMAKLIGFKDAKPGKNIELDPSISTLSTQERETFPAGEWETKNKLDPGITARWGFSPNMTLAAAVNPDFSQVEADVAQLDINTQFALYYPEKRPFFLEGSNIFETRLAGVYTRTLADPAWGVKLTGKQGANSIGIYSVQDEITNLVFPHSYWSDSTSLDTKSIGSVLRYRRDIGRISTLGFLVTDREGEDYYNRMLGLDAYFRVTRRKHINFQFMTSQSHYPGQVAADFNQPEEKIGGTALDVIFQHESRNIGYWVSYQQITPDFRADLGFIPQVGFRNVSAQFILASWQNPGHWYTFMNIMPTVEYEVDFNDQLIYKSFKFIYNYRGPLQSSLILVGVLGQRTFLGNQFDTNSLYFYSSLQPSGTFKLWLNGSYGDYIDFTNAQPGTRLTLNPGILIKAGRHFSINLDHAFERFNVPNGRLYTANVSNAQLIYQFNPRAFLRTILQYVDYDYNVENYLYPRDPRFKHLFSQVLFSYKINPQTVLFLGYSDDYYGFSIIPVTQNNRTLFLKIGYALVL